ncbi:hypothetical protein QBC40DRAFT_65996 [Triangularia verruculosa]|uniref:NACHT domain-containing protein n=1 Tax=Triangularia verruculosa TaxID=2587418 RepID=A0AAN6XWS4_9PEZI|nr:hypothetical protein QBC40DRAFT_65996 [Triangularia verruculosa]
MGAPEPAQAGQSICHFDSARKAFLSSLSPQDRGLYGPCESKDELFQFAEQLRSIVTAKLGGSRIVGAIRDVHDAFEPYFKVIEIFVSSSPEIAALIWGSLRLVLQLASNFVSFFDNVIRLLEKLTSTFRQYADVFDLCSKCEELRASRIPNVLEVIYTDVLEVLQSAVRIFTRSDGTAKRTTVVVGSLMWKPFHLRFQDQLDTLAEHRKSLFREISIWHVNILTRDRAREVAEHSANIRYRELNAAELKDASEERNLASEERSLADLERRQASEARGHTRTLLSQIQQRLQNLEAGRMESSSRNIIHWVSAPIFNEVLERSRKLRQPETATWIFREEKYRKWLNNELSAPTTSNGFGESVLWISGNPGSGKTVIASSIIDHLKSTALPHQDSPRDVYYYFFEYKLDTNNTACSAYRSIIAQTISRYRNDGQMINKFLFAMLDPNGNSGQPIAGEATVRDLLTLSLSSNSILILDGIDECVDYEAFLGTLAEVWRSIGPKILLLSRANVAILRRGVPVDNWLVFPKPRVSEDITIFSDCELQRLFDEGILPIHAESQKEDMVQRMVSGADGMFLWARLVINFTRSPYMDMNQRLHIFSQINAPEGLEIISRRIVELIKQSPKFAENLASKVLMQLIYAPCPISSRQLRQALVIHDILNPDWDPDTVREFEDSVIMACAGVVERCPLHQGTSESFLYNEPALRLIHRSVSEVLVEHHAISCLQEDNAPSQLQLLPDVVIGNLCSATTCLKQLLFYTPAGPLSGDIGRKVTANTLYSQFCFTDYAAVCWLLYLPSFVTAVATKSRPYVPWSAPFMREMSEFTAVLQCFLRNQRTVSVWIEAFYSTEYTHIVHPPSEALESFVTWARNALQQSPMLPIQLDLIKEMGDLVTEVQDVIRTWGESLRDTPQTVWDEMTGFLNSSRCFWNSNSTEVSYQRTSAPLHCGLKRDPVALLSRTSRSGDRKAVLSVWANALFYDGNSKAKAWQDGRWPVDLTAICSGWVATYEVWNNQPGGKRLARVEMPIAPSQMLIPMRSYWYHRFSTEINLPMAIDPSVSTFAILGTLASLKPSTDRHEMKLFTCQLPLEDEAAQEVHRFSWQAPITHNKQPAMYSITFAMKVDHLALLNWKDSGEQSITVCGYNHHVGLEVRVLHAVHVESGMMRIERLIFHPDQKILGYCVQGRLIRKWKSAAFIWGYEKDLPQSFSLIYDSHIQMFEAVGFSSCGLFFLVRPRFTDVPHVVHIPEHLLEQPPYSPFEVPSQACMPSSSHTSLVSTVAGTSLTPTGHGSSELWGINTATGYLSGLAVKASASGIDMTSTSNSGLPGHSMRLVTLPKWRGANETIQRIVLPKAEEDRLKISFDIDTQSLSTHSAYQLSKAGGGLPPVTVFRDTRFITLGQPSTGMLGTAPPPLTIGDAPRQQSKRKHDVKDGLYSDEEDTAKRRR